jgi:lipopolysaccharide export LptBFGC system permease protein LptF
VAASLILLFTFYVLLTFGKVMGVAGVMDPFWAVWLPNVVFIVIGTGMLIFVKK